MALCSFPGGTTTDHVNVGGSPGVDLDPSPPPHSGRGDEQSQCREGSDPGPPQHLLVAPAPGRHDHLGGVDGVNHLLETEESSAQVLAYRAQLRIDSLVLHFRAKGLRQGTFLFLATNKASVPLLPRPNIPVRHSAASERRSGTRGVDDTEQAILMSKIEADYWPGGEEVEEAAALRGRGLESEDDCIGGEGLRLGGPTAGGDAVAVGEEYGYDPRCWLTDESLPLAEALPIRWLETKRVSEVWGSMETVSEASAARVDEEALAQARTSVIHDDRDANAFMRQEMVSKRMLSTHRDDQVGALPSTVSATTSAVPAGRAPPPHALDSTGTVATISSLTLWLMPGGRAPVPSICCGVCGSSWEVDALGRGFRIYHLAVANNTLVWYVRRRFSEFLKLHGALVKEKEYGTFSEAR